MDKYQMLDQIILLMDKIADAKGAIRCQLIAAAVRMVDAIKKGIQEEDNATDARIRMLKDQIKNLTEPHPGDNQEVVGGETITYDYEPKIGERDHGRV